MLRRRFDIESFVAHADEIARLVPAESLFGWASRAFVVPAGFVALVHRAGSDPLIVRAGHEFEDVGRDAQTVLFLRDTPIECVVEESELRSEDGYECTGTLRQRVRILGDPAELAAFSRMIVGSSEVVRFSDLHRHLHGAMRSVLAAWAAGHRAAGLIAPSDADSLRAAVSAGLGGACLAAGLALDGQPVVRFESQAYIEHSRQELSLARRKEHVAARTQVQRALAAAQSEKLAHLVTMLERMRESISSEDSLSMRDLLLAFGEAERGEMYAALSRLCPAERKSRWAAAVSGHEVLLFDVAQFSRPVHRLRIPDSRGALRSISLAANCDGSSLALIGAASGVHVLDIDAVAVRCSLAAGEDRPGGVRGGFNAAARHGDDVFATHSELGVLRWSLRDPGAPARRLCAEIVAPATTVRAAQIAQGRLWFAADATLWSLSLEDDAAMSPIAYHASTAALSALTVAEGAVYAGDVEGRIIAWDADSPEAARSVRGPSGGPVESLHIVDAGGIERLIVADRSNGLLALVIGDSYSCRYEGRSAIIRRAAAADDLFIAMNDSRDRLLAWLPHAPGEPSATVIVPHLTGSTIQDIALIPAPI